MSKLFLFFIILAFLCEYVNAHVPEGQGNALQFYSGWCTSPPVLNGNITDAVNPPGLAVSGTTPDEWENAFCRRIYLVRSDGTPDPNPCYIYLMNDANFLYIGLVYYHDNNGNPNCVNLYFDEGPGGGSHDDALTANNENAVGSNRTGAAWNPWDRYWDGTNWVNDASIDFAVADGYYTDRFQWEFRIPLNLGGQDLLVNGGNGILFGDEIGFLIEIVRNGGTNPGNYYYNQTNLNPNNATVAPGWMDVRLGVPKKFMTFAATKNVNGNPTVNGFINEDAWRGSYQRNIVLTDFFGNTMNAKIYGVHDPTGFGPHGNVYIGLKVYDATNNAGDYCQIYQEQEIPGPTSTRDFLLNNNYENALQYGINAGFVDRYWDNVNRVWQNDASAFDPVNGSGNANYNVDHWEYEFVFPQDADQYDLDEVNDNARIGFLIRYYDAATARNFYWDASVNADYEFIDQTGNVNIAVGWAYLQLGAPYLQIIHPEDGATLEGTYPIDCYVEPVAPAVIDSVQYQLSGEVTWRHLTRVNQTYYWSTNWNTTSYADGSYELRVRAIDSNGNEVVQIINITINNAGAPANAPIVALTLPSAGDIVSGITNIQWNSQPQGGATLVGADSVQIDGDNWLNASLQPPAVGGVGSYNWNTTLETDGSHILRVKSIDDGGRVGYSSTRLVLVDNTGPNIEDITFNYPSGQTAAKFGDNVIITAYVTDNISGVNSVILDGTNLNGVAANAMLDNGVAPDEFSGDNIYTVQITVTNPATATVNWTINAIDNEGNTRSITRNAILDNTPPTIVGIITLDPDIYYRDGEHIHLRATCGEAGLRLTANFVNIDNNYISGAENVADIGGGNYDITYTISQNNQRPTGSYNISVTAYDMALNSATSSILLDLDNTPPEVFSPSLADADDILNANDTLMSTLSDTANGNHNIISAEYFVDVIGGYGEGTSLNASDGAFDEPTEDVKVFFPITSLTEGAHTVYVRGKDIVGNCSAPLSLQFKVDREGPIIQDVEVKYPFGQTGVKNGDQIIITALITDRVTQVNPNSVNLDGTNLNGLAINQMYDDGTNGDAVAGDDIYTCTITISTGLNGIQNFTITASDIVPNAGIPKIGSVMLDNTPPDVIAVGVLTPPDPDNIYRNGETVHLRLWADGIGYKVSGNFYPIDVNYTTGSENVTDNLDNTYDITYTISETNTRVDSSYTIWIKAIDCAGNIDSGSVILRLDNTGPITSNIDFILDPINDNILNSSDTLIALVQDSTENIKSAEYFIDVIGEYGTGTPMLASDGSFDELIESVKAAFLIPGNLAEGQHTVYIHGQSQSNEWGPPSSHIFIVDTRPPKIENIIVNYPDGQNAVRDSQLVKITAIITDATTRVDPTTVILDGTNLNGNPNTPMRDDGTGGDEVADDNTYTALVLISTGLNGAQPFTITASDIVPNQTTSNIATVMLDNTPPLWVSTNCGDADKIYKNGDQITIITKWDGIDYKIKANFSNIDEFYEPGSENVVNNGDSTYTITYTISLNNTIPDSQIIIIPITAYDCVGNGPITDFSYRVELDNTAPDFRFIDTERDNYMDGDLVVVWVGFTYKKSDDTLYTLKCNFSNIDSRYYEGNENVRFDSIAVGIAYYTITYRISDDSLNTTPDGSYEILLYAKDLSGNTSSQSTSIELDNTPEPVTILQPQPGEIFNGNVLIDVTAPDDARFVCFCVSPDGINWYDLHGNPDTCTIDSNGSDGWTQVWDTENDNLPDATTYRIRVAGYDEMQPFPHLIAEDTTDGSIIIDNTPPNLLIGVLPLPVDSQRLVSDSLKGEVYKNEIILKGRHSDETSGMETIIVEIKNEQADNINNSPIIIPAKDSTFSRIIKLIEGINYITVTAIDKAKNSICDSSIITYIPPDICAEIGPDSGIVTAPDGTKLIIPKGALLKKTKICIKPVEKNMLVPCDNKEIKLLKIAHDFIPNGLIFHKPVSMVLPYTDADLDINQDNKPDYPEDSLSVFFFDGNEWLKVGNPKIDTITNSVTIDINHFTVFDLGIDRRTIPDKIFVFLTHNPFKPIEGTTICFILPEPGEVTLKIYDLAGDVVRVVTREQKFDKGENSIKWDGKNAFDKYVGSGIYIYVLQYKSESGKYDKIIKKPIGVIK